LYPDPEQPSLEAGVRLPSALDPLTATPGKNQPSVAVFCGARSATARAVSVTRELGHLVGEAGYRLVYGGGGRGLMGEVAWAAHRNGSPILGVVPDFLYKRERHIAAPPQEVRLTETLAERKGIMLAEADAFIALPGGYGTLDEILDVISAAYLGVHDRPLALLQPDGEWEALVALLNEVVRRGYASPVPPGLVSVVDTAAAALEAVAAAGSLAPQLLS
jgi:cytokinin riboside 5'-monophosphate phosphoribohydrolase